MADTKCENCMEWEYFEGYGYGCFAMRTMVPLDAKKCPFYAYKYTLKSNIHIRGTIPHIKPKEGEY